MNRLLFGACALRFLDSFVLIAPFYTVMFAENGLTPSQIGLILASWSAVCLVLEVPSGLLADRMSRRWLMAIAQLLRCLGFAVWIAFPGFWGFLIGLMLWGLKSATLSGAFEAALFDELKALGRQSEYVRVFGRTQSARFAGLLAAALVAAPMSVLGYPVLIAVSVVGGVAAAASALLLPKAPRAMSASGWNTLRHLKQGLREAASLPGVPSLLLFIASTQAVVSALADYWQIFGQQVGLPKPGIALFVAALAGSGVLAASVAHRLHRLPPLALSLMIAVAGLCVILAGAVWQPWSVVLPVIYVAIFWSVDVNADARFQHALRGETRATVASLKGFVMQGGTVFLMLSFGLVAEAQSYRTAFMVSGALAVLIGLVFALASRYRPAPIGPRA
ncbi:MAG: MFS transporter [Phenylobacterium sp.]|nr:MFS transporter [Phenylobacterium sp.]